MIHDHPPLDERRSCPGGSRVRASCKQKAPFWGSRSQPSSTPASFSTCRVAGWRAGFDGVLIGAALLTTWTLGGSRRAAAAGPMTAVMLALLGTVAFEPAFIYFRASFGWAVLLALGVRSPTRVGRPTVYENALPTEHVGIAGSAQPLSRARCQLGLEAPCSNPALLPPRPANNHGSRPGGP